MKPSGEFPPRALERIACGLVLALATFLTGCGCSEQITGTPDSSTDTLTETEDTVSESVCGDCDDGDPCTEDSCDPVTGECVREPIDGDGDGYAPESCGGDDCDDTDDAVYPGAPEVCMDGVDQDCDGIVDGPKAMLGTTHLKYLEEGISPSVAWTGSEYLVVWGTLDIELARVDLDGELLEEPINLTNTAPRRSSSPVIVWSGSEAAVMYYEFENSGCHLDDIECPSNAKFMRLTPGGSIIDGPTTLNDDDAGALSTSIAWTGSEYGVVWEDSRDGPCPTYGTCERELYFSRVSSDGIELGPEVRFTDGDGTVSLGLSRRPMLWTTSEYLVLWHRNVSETATTYLSRIVPSDVTISEPMIMDDSLSAASWTGSAVASVWHDDASGSFEVYSATHALDGTPLHPQVQITDEGIGAGFPSLAWASTALGVTWFDGRNAGCSPVPFEWMGPCNPDLYFALLGPDGTVLWDDIRLTHRETWKNWQDMVWTGSEFGIAWFELDQDTEHPGWYVSFDRIAFCD